tara:strand:+ start:2361 stop:2759 length:399 start_codon:yes stop_codon:yes gene_type:complete
MEYITVLPEGQLNSLERARIITRELYNLERPVFLQTEDEAENTFFGIITHPEDDTRAALFIDTRAMIAIHPNCTLERLVAMFPELTPEERFSLSSTIHQLDFIQFGMILPDSVTVRDAKYMAQNGWFVLNDP